MATTYIHRTNSGGSGTTATISMWVKQNQVTADGGLFSISSDSTNRIDAYSNPTVKFRTYISSSYAQGDMTLNVLNRDPAAWYHYVFVFDTTNGTPGDRMRLWINGVRATGDKISADTDPSDSYSFTPLVSGIFALNKYGTNSTYSDHEYSHVHYTDGYAYDASTFGEFDSTSGIWKIKTSPSVTYGTNGWFLKFEDRTNLDLDSGTNAFTDFTTVGTITATYDTPDNNFATLNPLTVDDGGAKTYSNGNTTVAETANSWTSAHSSLAVAAGKWYFESKFTLTSSTEGYFGCAAVPEINFKSSSTFYLGAGASIGYYTTSGEVTKDSASTAYGDAVTTGQIMGLALDITNELAYFSINGVWQNSADPVAGSGGVAFPSGMTDGEYICLSVSPNQSYWECNFGNGYFGTTAVASTNADDAGIGSFEYDVPTGYYALCTKNIKAYGG